MKHLIKIALVVLIVVAGCKKHEQGETEWTGLFFWTGWINGSWHGAWKIHCNTWCGSCSAIVDGTPKHLSKSDYKEVYSICEGLPTFPPTPIDTTKKDPIPLGKVEFKKSSSTKFGYDEWKTGSTERVPKESYVSVAAGDIHDDLSHCECFYVFGITA